MNIFLLNIEKKLFFLFLILNFLSALQFFCSNSTFQEVERILLEKGLKKTNDSVFDEYFSLSCAQNFNAENSDEIVNSLKNINQTDIIAFGGIPMKDEYIKDKKLMFSIPTGTHYFVALSYGVTNISFYSFMGYLVENSVFFVFMILIFFGGLFIYFCEKKQNMTFKTELLVGLTLGMWHIYQLFYKKTNYRIKSITGRILTIILLSFFSWLVLYLFCLLIINRYKQILQKRQSNSQVFEFSRIYTNEKYLSYFSNYPYQINTFNSSDQYSSVIDVLQNDNRYILVTDIMTAREFYSITCNFNTEATNFGYFTTGVLMIYTQENLKLLNLINKAILLVNNSSDFLASESVVNYYNSDCNLAYSSFFSTSTESTSITYVNLLDVFILVLSGIAMAIIAVIFSKKALVYFHKKKKVKRLLKELNSSETRVLKDTDIFFTKQKEKTINILKPLETDLMLFYSRESKCFEYLDHIYEWIENSGNTIQKNS